MRSSKYLTGAVSTGEEATFITGFYQEMDFTRIELRIERNDAIGLLPGPGKSAGVLIGFLCPFDADGNKRFADPYESNRFITLKYMPR